MADLRRRVNSAGRPGAPWNLWLVDADGRIWQVTARSPGWQRTFEMGSRTGNMLEEPA